MWHTYFGYSTSDTCPIFTKLSKGLFAIHVTVVFVEDYDTGDQVHRLTSVTAGL